MKVPRTLVNEAEKQIREVRGIFEDPAFDGWDRYEIRRRRYDRAYGAVDGALRSFRFAEARWMAELLLEEREALLAERRKDLQGFHTFRDPSPLAWAAGRDDLTRDHLEARRSRKSRELELGHLGREAFLEALVGEDPAADLWEEAEEMDALRAAGDSLWRQPAWRAQQRDAPLALAALWRREGDLFRERARAALEALASPAEGWPTGREPFPETRRGLEALLLLKEGEAKKAHRELLRLHAEGGIVGQTPTARVVLVLAARARERPDDRHVQAFRETWPGKADLIELWN